MTDYPSHDITLCPYCGARFPPGTSLCPVHGQVLSAIQAPLPTSPAPAPPLVAAYPAPGYGQPQTYGHWPAYMPLGYAGFWIRLAAFLVDLFIFMFVAVCLGFLIPGAVTQTEVGPYICHPEIHQPGVGCTGFPGPIVPSPAYVVAMVAAAICYFGGLWWLRGATIGQSLLGLRVVREVDGGPLDAARAAVRILFFVVGFLAVYAGWLWVAFEPRKRGWHDMMAKTIVVREMPVGAAWRRLWPF